MNNQVEYGNDFERTVIGSEGIDPKTYPREFARYKFASKFIKSGMRVLEIGCSSGFSTTVLPKDIYYTGIDYDAEVVKFAQESFPGYNFICATIDEFLTSIVINYDVIIAFEVLEHIPNGREVAQKLKEHCKTLLISTPYREPKGLWGKHHVLHQLKEVDFPRFNYKYMTLDGSFREKPDLTMPNLLIMSWEKHKVYQKKKTVLCCIPTKNRTPSLLHALQSVALQTVKPDKLIICDDGNHYDFRQDPIGKYIGPLLLKSGIDWEMLFMPGKGQHVAHEVANMSGFDFVWRVDDDSIVEPDVLERLLNYMDDEKVGAVGGAVYELEKKVYNDPKTDPSKIVNFFDCYNFQWAPDQGVKEMDWLYSSFLYRAGIVHYKHNMSPVAFHEETIFTHRLKRAGYKLIADTSIYTYHFKCPSGGCREEDHKWAYEWDNAEFLKIMEKEWKIKVVAIRGGIGDNFAFLNILPELQKKYDQIIISTCHPEVYEGYNVKTLAFREDMTVTGEIYSFMSESNWKGSLVDAFRGLYL